MYTVTLVTGNKGKLAEWQRLLPADFELENIDLDLDEIQSLDLEKIITDKARRAYEVVGKPIIVEDVSAGLDNLGGLPGPFMKFFEKQLGNDALFRLANNQESPAIIHYVTTYYDGTDFLTVFSEVKGSVGPVRGTNGFGFDFCFVPDGQVKTYAEMSPAEKDKVSHRGKAVRELIPKLRKQLSKP